MARPKQCPKHIRAKMERANKLMQQVVDLNVEIETWLEDNGVTSDGYDFFTDWREMRGYEYTWMDDVIEQINEKLAE